MQTASLLQDEAAPVREGADERLTPWRQPVVWLGAMIFLASLAGCIAIIVLASRHDEKAAGSATDSLMKVPIHRVVVDPSPSPAAPAGSVPAASLPAASSPTSP